MMDHDIFKTPLRHFAHIILLLRCRNLNLQYDSALISKVIIFDCVTAEHAAMFLVKMDQTHLPALCDTPGSTGCPTSVSHVQHTSAAFGGKWAIVCRTSKNKYMYTTHNSFSRLFKLGTSTAFICFMNERSVFHALGLQLVDQNSSHYCASHKSLFVSAQSKALQHCTMM